MFYKWGQRVDERHTESLASYLKWGLIGTFILGFLGLAYVALGTMGPEYVRRLEPKHFIPLAILVPVGFLAGCALKWVSNRMMQSE